MITSLAIAGYRSLRDLSIELGRLNIVTGANGSGKSSFYRSLRLMSDIAHGQIVSSLAGEGGLDSTLWAGPETFSRAVREGTFDVEGLRRRGPVSLKLGFSGDDYGYAMDLGFPTSPGNVTREERSKFLFDPVIKLEALWTGARMGRANLIAERRGPSVRVRDAQGAWAQAHTSLAPFDTMMTHCADPRDGLELLVVRETMRNWRFYDHFRTDSDAPARRPQIGTRAPALASDGRDLAAALQTIREVGASEALDEAVADAFPGARVGVEVQAGACFEVRMSQHGLLRPLSAAELSDGTLRYLLLVAALLSPRPPGLMILNEPETSLHGDLIPALARLIAAASGASQLIVVSHCEPLISALAATCECREIVLRKERGETIVDGAGASAWVWPRR